MKKKEWIAFAIALIIGLSLAGLGLYGGFQSNRLQREENDLMREQRDVLYQILTRQSAMPTRTPYPNNDPNDPICGDPVEFKKHFPANASPATNANTHKH